MRIADDGEVLLKGGVVFQGYWHNEEATREAFDEDGWFRTGDLGSLDDDGYLTITGRKKDLIVTAGGKNVAPAVLEDRLRAHWLVSQCLVVGDRRPYVAAMLTIDADVLPQWLAEHGHSDDAPIEAIHENPDLLAELQSAVDDANKAVSNAEAIKRFAVLPEDFTVDDRPADPDPQGQAGRRHRSGMPPRSTTSTRAPARGALSSPRGFPPALADQCTARAASGARAEHGHRALGAHPVLDLLDGPLRHLELAARGRRPRRPRSATPGSLWATALAAAIGTSRSFAPCRSSTGTLMRPISAWSQRRRARTRTRDRPATTSSASTSG